MYHLEVNLPSIGSITVDRKYQLKCPKFNAIPFATIPFLVGEIIKIKIAPSIDKERLLI